MLGDDKYIGVVGQNGRTHVYDPNLGSWHDISSLPGYPVRGADDISVISQGANRIHITVRGTDAAGHDVIRQTSCRVSPVPGRGGNPRWPRNCTAFFDFTPPA
ncbi:MULTISPECIES: hypothetical protein [unclassified Actinomadura]|uniref:hypothetical protein n=1 Tax=unclassified Actinomadura TaxID=2626254 RepID=UPI00190F13D5|nr:hypothetical protein [Actinomadura sp. K4S16]